MILLSFYLLLICSATSEDVTLDTLYLLVLAPVIFLTFDIWAVTWSESKLASQYDLTFMSLGLCLLAVKR
jgi:hypothetical protein